MSQAIEDVTRGAGGQSRVASKSAGVMSRLTGSIQEVTDSAGKQSQDASATVETVISSAETVQKTILCLTAIKETDLLAEDLTDTMNAVSAVLAENSASTE